MRYTQGNLIMTATPRNEVAFDLSNLTSADLKAALVAIQAKEKADKLALSSKPRHAFLIIMENETIVRWAGQADTEDQAKLDAIVYAEKDGAKVFDLCKRPLPDPKGRKAGSTIAKKEEESKA
jgi:hypothetical protein